MSGGKQAATPSCQPRQPLSRPRGSWEGSQGIDSLPSDSGIVIALSGETRTGVTVAAKPTIKVGVADDHPLFRLGVRKLLEPESDLTMVAEASNGMEAILLVEKFSPDVLLLDLKMPVMDGIEVLSELAKRKLRSQVILMMSNADRDKAVRGVRLGARGIVFKDADPALLPKSIRKVYDGEVWIDNPILSQALETLVSKPAAPPLQPRDGSRPLRGHGTAQQRSGRQARRQRSHHQEPPDQHLLQARRLRPPRAHPLRHPQPHHPRLAEKL